MAVASDKAPARAAARLLRFGLAGTLLALALAFGAGLVPAPRLFDWFAAPLAPRRTAVPVESLPADAFAFRPTAATRHALGDDEGEIAFLQVAYADERGRTRTALLHPPPAADGDTTETRWHWWLQTAAAIRKHASASARIVAWWDNGQRAHLLSGRPVWSDAPTTALFPPEQGAFWREVAGGFADDPQPLAKLARWLTAPAEEAVAALHADNTSDDLLLLVSTDDLARADEIASAGGERLPVESKVFPTSTNLHGTINTVRRWAQEAGTGSYLVQPLPGGRVRAWRVTDTAALEWLLIRALPFSTSLYRPIDGADLVFQSGGGGYLSVYRIRGGGGAPRPVATR